MNSMNYFWLFVRGDVSGADFECYIYEYPELEEELGTDLYNNLLLVNYKDPYAVEKTKDELITYLSANYRKRCSCCMVRDLDRFGFGAEFAENFFSCLEEVRRRGKKYWWISLEKCKICGQFWLVAQDEEEDDFYLFRLNVEDVLQIEMEKWPMIFDDYNKLRNLLSNSSRFSSY